MIVLLLLKLLALALVPVAFSFGWTAIAYLGMKPHEWEYEKARLGLRRRKEADEAAQILTNLKASVRLG